MVSVLEVSLIALAAGAATGIGALPILVTDRISHRTYDGAVGMAAGIMFGAAVFALIVPGLEFGGIGEVLGGFVVGGVALLAINRTLPHVHLRFRGPESHGTDDTTGLEDAENWRQAVLIAGSITIHNIPEGLAIGIAFASGLDTVGIALAIAIAVQNVPDGFAMAVPADRAGLSKGKTILYTTLSGAVPEPIAAALGFALVAIVSGLFPAAAGFAAGTMIAVVFREMIPSSHGHGFADLATLTFLTGFGVMLVVDTVLAV
ncbi:ZIP family metal transporter [Natranaeroarchaeum aerophilus]|uniref:ZIP family metal transporter n=1 Tax=Natranaeroarchaeum aerophilus TaxID=2917711 RepID=A0AAE3FPY0_9EURY|nr:ZIP family metal transporter [Natranaeroarchaeum aerophilus]MCL9813099.1 ZIP family metal transporter [Natranaeroarchaeum aerophilus]